MMSNKDEAVSTERALKLALEALEYPGNIWHMSCPKDKAITAIREALAEQPAQQGCMRCNTPKKCALYGCSPLTWPSEQPAQQALDKMAENARELGLDYEPAQHRAWFTVDELNAWADKKLKENPQWAEQPAQQEAQAEETVKERTPQERRDAGEWHCPECFTFGHQHRQGCTAAHGIKENT